MFKRASASRWGMVVVALSVVAACAPPPDDDEDLAAEEALSENGGGSGFGAFAGGTGGDLQGGSGGTLGGTAGTSLGGMAGSDSGGTAGGGTAGGGTAGGGAGGTSTVGGVDIDVDRNRNDMVDDIVDDPDEDQSIKFLERMGALVLVNCDSDVGRTVRDMEDFDIAGADDLQDLSPLSLELKEDLKPDEELWLVLKSKSADGKLWINVLDTSGGTDKVLVGPAPHASEIRIDNLSLEGGAVIFPGGLKHRYDHRFYIEGLNFNKEMELTLEIRGGTSEIKDVVRVRTTPWLANNNTQPLANTADWSVPGNLVNSDSYRFANPHGAAMQAGGAALEFVQDSVEWGFQVRRRNDHPAFGRAMITALRLHSQIENKHPLTEYLGPKVGVYGYAVAGNSGVSFDPYIDTPHFTQANGDQGGNLECLPPSDAYPFGRLVYGDTMSNTLREFLAAQEAQVGGAGPVVVPISKVNLQHVDEVLFIAPAKKAFIVGMPDWQLGSKLLNRAKNVRHNILLVTQGTNTLTTYGDIAKWLKKDGQATDALFSTALDGMHNQLAATGASVLKLPGLFLEAQGDAVHPDNLRGFPRNIANSQPTVAGKLVVSGPPDQTSGKNKPSDSLFLTEWTKLLKAKGIAAEAENMRTAWLKGGEAHCSSNTLREPIRK